MLYLVGLGLSDETDITVKGLEVVKKASRVYLEAYTSILLVEQSVLESYYGRSITVADREMVESNSDEILRNAQNEDVAFLVVGDPFGATTHTDLVLRARELEIPVRTVPNASIMSGIGACGLQLYNFGQTVSMVFFTDSWKPASFYDRIKENRQIGLHTLVLVDIKVKEQSLENMARGRLVYEPPRYMTVGQCAQQMLEIEDERKEGVYTKDSLAIGAARVGGKTEKFVAGTLEELCSTDEELGAPLHSLVLLGRRTHELELDYVRQFAVDKEKFERLWNADLDADDANARVLLGAIVDTVAEVTEPSLEGWGVVLSNKAAICANAGIASNRSPLSRGIDEGNVDMRVSIEVVGLAGLGVGVEEKVNASGLLRKGQPW
ncbi:hypothetical protein HG530_010429 [Fusarium avenaceum]|nr:hypothetical protein HG530_010429 [Fusarium avenaceum]